MFYGDQRLFESYLFSIYSCCIGQQDIASNTYSDDDTLFVVDLSAYMKNENTFSNLKQELFDKINKDKIIFRQT